MSEASLQPFRTEGSIIVPWTSDQTAFKTPVVLDMLARMLELVTVASDKGFLAVAAVVAGCLSDVMFALFSGRLLISSATDFLTQASKVMRPHMDSETFKLMFLDVLREVYDDIYAAASSEKLDDVGRDPKKLLQTLQQRARTQLSAFLQALLSCHTIKRRDLFEVFDTSTLDLVNLPFRGVQKWSTRVRTKVLYTLPVYTLFRENPRGYSEVLRLLTLALYADVRKPVDEALVSLISEESLCARRVMEICVVTVGSDWQAPNASFILDRLLFRYEDSLPEFVCRRLDLLQMHSDLCGQDGAPFAELERLSRRGVSQCVGGLLRVLAYLIQSGVVSLEAARKHVGPSLPVVAEMFGRLRVLTKSKEITSADFAALLRQEHHERWPSGTVGLSSECLYSPQECEDGAAESAVESALPARRCVLLTRDPVTLAGAADTINLQDYLQYVNGTHIPLFMLIAALVDLGAWTQAEVLWDELVVTGAIPLLNQDVRDAMTRRFPLEVTRWGSPAALLSQTQVIAWVTQRMRCHVGWSVPLLDSVAGLALELNSMEGLSILQMHVLPGCLCGPAVPAVAAKAWACLKTLPPRSRFETYTALIHHIDSDPLTAHFHSQARTSVSRILKRITSNGSSSHRSDLESALDNLGVKLPVSFKRSRLASQHEKDVLTTLCSLAILDPMATMEVVLRNVEWFDKNFGTTVVQSLKFIPDLTVDIGVMLMLDQVDGSEYQVGQPLPRKLVNCTHFASLFFRQFPRRVMSSFMHVVLRHLETAVGDASFPQRIPSAMGDIHYFVGEPIILRFTQPFSQLSEEFLLPASRTSR
ncbi:MAG: hypothetical protein KVP17_004541 [Porospora cf. gigantea B]|uniref:uncharacterized protein n=1 Tax=Porospora cf. gigantea B TaxID=2853592 RepID=UPI0035719C34|nr:MAG: hypothetical protein KVP17_004541 [Porospora cf. gigantea B]